MTFEQRLEAASKPLENIVAELREMGNESRKKIEKAALEAIDDLQEVASRTVQEAVSQLIEADRGRLVLPRWVMHKGLVIALNDEAKELLGKTVYRVGRTELERFILEAGWHPVHLPLYFEDDTQNGGIILALRKPKK